MYINVMRTILSLRKRNDYPMYSMTYYGEYGFDEFLAVGAENDEDLLKFVQNRLIRKKKRKFNMPNSGCTAFIAREPNGDVLFARNYDFPLTPSLVLKTKPSNRHASILVVDLMGLGYAMDNLPKGLSKKLPLLATPYMPFDGMNEKGLAVAILMIPKTDLPNDPGKITLNTTTAIRMLLDNAATVDEAINLLGKHNIYFSLDVYCHYFIADSSGKSVIVEYFDGKMHVIEESIASNFYACNGISLEDEDETPSPRERYDKAKNTLTKCNSIMSITDAGKLLCDLGIYENGKNILQWSVIYNLTALKGMVFPGRDMSKPYLFRIK